MNQKEASAVREPPPDPGRPDRPTDLKRAAASGVVWQGAAYMMGKLLVLGATIVLARILVPEDFGLVALALIFIGYAEVTADLGVAQALVYLPAGPRRNDAALAVSLAVSAVLASGAALAAPLIAGFFERPDVVPLLRVLSLSLFLSGLAQVPDALLRRDLRFRDRMYGQLGRASGRGGVAIALAFMGFGPWALVIGHLAGDVAHTAILWWRVDHRPGRFWRIGIDDVRPLLSFGAAAAGAALLAKVIFDLDYLVIGRILGAEALGFYQLAFRLPEMAIINVFFVFSAVAFPAYSAAKDDPARLRRGYLKSVRIQSGYGVLAGMGLAAIAPMAVPLLFGAKWEPAVAPLQGLAVYAALRSLGAGAVDVYKATGKPRIAVWVALLRLVVLVPVLLYASRYGITGVAWAQAAAAGAFVLLMQGVAARVIGVRVRDLLAAVGPSILAGAAVVLAAGAVRVWLPLGDLLLMLTTIVAGGLAGVGTLLVLAPDVFTEIVTLLRRRTGSPA